MNRSWRKVFCHRFKLSTIIFISTLLNRQMSGPAIATIATGVAIVAVPAIVAGPILGALGFGAAGVAAGSTAAGVQSGIGSVAAGSLFATLQSASAGGYGVAIVHGAVQAVGAVVGARGVGAWFRG
ncbi:hypothetical protein SNK03_008569 [Fusarium graminearum]